MRKAKYFLLRGEHSVILNELILSHIAHRNVKLSVTFGNIHCKMNLRPSQFYLEEMWKLSMRSTYSILKNVADQI